MSWCDLPDVMRRDIISIGNGICKNEFSSHKEKFRMSLFYIKNPYIEDCQIDNRERCLSMINSLYQTFITFGLYLKILFLLICDIPTT